MISLFKKVLAVCLYSIFSFEVFSQTPIVVDFLDLSTYPASNPKRLTYGEKYKFVIQNINLNLYKVEGSVRQTKFNEELPAIFAGVKLPTNLNIVLPETPANTIVNAGIAAPNAIINRNSDFEDRKNKIDTILKMFNSKITTFKETINKSITLSNAIKNASNRCSVDYNTVEHDLIISVNKFLDLVNRTNVRNDQANAIIKKFDSEIIATNNNKIYLDSAVKIQVSICDEIILDRVIDMLNSENRNEEITDSITLLKRLEKKPKITKKIFELEDEQIFINRRIAILQKAIGELKAYKESLIGLLEKASSSLKDVNDFDNDNKIQNLVDAYNSINITNFTFTSEDIEVDSDEVKFEYKIIPQKLLPCEKPDKLSISKTLVTRKGVKIDFSTGGFINYGGQDFLGRDIQYKPDPSDEAYTTIQAKDGGKRSLLSVGALMHIYYRFGTKFNIALSPGLSSTTGFDALNFHIGLSAIMGRKQRVVLTFGHTLKQSKILDKNYQFDFKYKKKELPEAPPTITVFPVGGWLFGLTYNLSKLKKQG